MSETIVSLARWVRSHEGEADVAPDVQFQRLAASFLQRKIADLVRSQTREWAARRLVASQEQLQERSLADDVIQRQERAAARFTLA